MAFLQRHMEARDHITLSVFPFEDLSPQNEPGIFCRAFSADLTTELSRFRQFDVITLPAHVFTSSPSFDALDTDYFIQGTFRCEKDQVRINVQLYHSATRHMVWGNRFEGKLTGLSEMQDTLLAAVVSVLQQQINHDLLSRLRKRPKIPFSAYEHWLHGMEELRKGSIESDTQARHHFAQALQIQPDYSLAHTGMSLSYFNEWSCQLWERWDVSKTGAYEWAQKAIELDDNNYLAAMVLGKILMYEGSYDTSEYYFRKSLFLNSNDPDSLMQIALCFMFLGLDSDAIALYEKAIQLNPFNVDKYSVYGVFLYFEYGDYEKAATLLRENQPVKLADAEAYYAALFYHLGDEEKMKKHWKRYLDTYRRLISKGADFEAEEAISWIMKISPYRYKTNLESFLRHIGNGAVATRQEQPGLKIKKAGPCYFVKDAAGWKLSYDGDAVQVPELKGFYDIKEMLSHPRQVFHCAELIGTRISARGEKLIDEKARQQYHDKIRELQQDIQEAEAHGNQLQLERLQEEYDKLLDFLSRSLGLKGRSRESGSTVEKARSALTWRIRNAIARIEQYHPLLGAHLSNAIKTGTVCSYQPDREIVWGF